MKEQFTVSGYNITTSPQFQSKRFGITPELEKQLGSLGLEIQNKKNKKMIDQLTQLILKYPTVPQLKNYLSVAYNAQGNYKKAMEVNDWIIAEHPDYLFAKINQVNVFIDNAEFEKVPQIMGEAMEIKQLYPERDLFHLSEVTGYLRVAIRYFAAIGNFELAENRMKILREIAPDHSDTEKAEFSLFKSLMERGIKRKEEENKQRISPNVNNAVAKLNNNNVPQFNHPEILSLYQYGLHIPHDILREIIALPRASLIEDLDRVLLDAVERYGYFGELDFEDETHSFVLHALFLLKEINAEESLPKILSFLESNYELLDYWLSDHKTETLWQCIYGLGFTNTTILKQFLLQPGIDTYSKVAVSEALCQMVLHCPERREEILTTYSDVFTIFSIANGDDNLIDTEFLGLAIGDTIDCRLSELLPIIKILFEKGYVAKGINGDYKKVEKEFEKEPRFDRKRKVYNIFELYDSVLSSWHGYQKDKKKNNEAEYDYSKSQKIPQQAISEKIGRNDLCPCGSGKKYKKCCLK